MIFIGVDPGFSGAIASITAAGVCRVWDIPITHVERKEYDLGKLNIILQNLRDEESVVGLEWPSTRPGEGAERAKRFGVGMGQLESMLYVKRFDYKRIPPATWKQHLGLPGKTIAGWEEKAVALFQIYYPDWIELLRGPRGGLLDGRLDALLIAHYMRVNHADGMRGVVAQHGRESAEAEALVLGAGRQGKKKMRGV